jgi:hypothetical protein
MFLCRQPTSAFFHAAAKCPQIKLGVEYHLVDRDEADQETEFQHDRHAATDAPGQDAPPLPEYCAPGT